MGYDGSLWVLVGLYGSLCVIVGPNVFLWVLMDFCGCLWVFMGLYRFLSVLSVARKGGQGGTSPPGN